LFGILGLALADPIVAMVKAALQQMSEEGPGGSAAAEP
jgi:predicted PurR-regulated permease PerM